MPRSKKRPNFVPLLMPSKNNSRNTSRNNMLTSNEKYYLKNMNKKDIIKLYIELDELDKTITGLTFDFITSDNALETFRKEDQRLFSLIYKDNPFVPDREVIKITEIIYKDKTKKLSYPIYFFKSTGKSRSLSTNGKLNTTDIWFPTNKYPFELDFKKVRRITKLEDLFLLSNKKPNDKTSNIMKYGRFITLENALISKFLFETLK